MTWTLVGTPTVAFGVTSVNPAVPSGHQSGDLILYYCHGNNNITYITGEPSGYTRLYSQTGTADNNTWALYGKVATSTSEAAATCTWASTPGVKSGQVICLRDSNGVMSLGSILGGQAVSTGFNSASIPYPACAVGDDGYHDSVVLIFGLVGKNNDPIGTAYTQGGISGFTQYATADDAGAYGKNVAMYYQKQTTATNISSGTISISGYTAGYVGSLWGVVFYVKANTPSGSQLTFPHRSSGGMIDLSGNFRG